MIEPSTSPFILLQCTEVHSDTALLQEGYLLHLRNMRMFQKAGEVKNVHGTILNQFFYAARGVSIQSSMRPSMSPVWSMRAARCRMTHACMAATSKTDTTSRH